MENECVSLSHDKLTTESFYNLCIIPLSHCGTFKTYLFHEYEVGTRILTGGDIIAEGKQSSFISKRDVLLSKADGLALEADHLSYEGKYEDAIDRYDKAISIYPSNPDLWAFKAITLSGGLNRDEEAMQCWERAKKLDSVLADAITYSSMEQIITDESDLKDFHGSTADRIRNLIKQKPAKFENPD